MGGDSEGADKTPTHLNLIIEFEPQKSLIGDALTCSAKAKLVQEAAAVDGSKIVNKKSETRDRNDDPSLAGVSAGPSSGRDRKLVYSRKEMEALRFVNFKAKKKFWQQVHNGLEKTVKKEYEELGGLKNHHWNVYRRQDADMGSCSAQGIVGEPSLEDLSCDTEITSSMHPCDASNNEDFNVLVEEWSEEEEEEESEDECESIQKPAFFIEGEPDFESGSPEDGFEYLRRVRWEVAHIPKVKVAKIDNTKLKSKQSGYIPKIPKIEKCPPHLAPSKQWEDEFIADFSELRVALSRLDDAGNTTLSDAHSIIFNPWAVLELPKGGPTLSAILDMDPATRVAVLKRCVSLFETGSNMSKDDYAWLFALCAAIDYPLDADTCASLRCLLRRCAKLRAGKTELDDEVVMLNVLATISGKFFRQSDN